MTDEQEREANQFAMCLLMPEKMVRDWIKRYDVRDWSLTEDDIVKMLAKDFGVSLTVATLRLQQLGIWKLAP